MDKIPYDFIDRVFTKLNNKPVCMWNPPNIENLHLQAPLWAQARRVYERRTEHLSILISLMNDGVEYTIKSEQRACFITLEQFIRMDSRFTRIFSLKMCALAGKAFSGQTEAELYKLIGLLSTFNIEGMIVNLEDVELHSSGLKFLEECVKCGLRTTYLKLFHHQDAENLCKTLLDAEELQQLDLRSDWPHEFKRKIEAFVCRPDFKYLKCNYECLDMDCLKRIIAYWRELDDPWDPAHLQVKTTLDLRNEFASWLPSTSAPRRFEEMNGDFRVRVTCYFDYTQFEFF